MNGVELDPLVNDLLQCSFSCHLSGKSQDAGEWAGPWLVHTVGLQGLPEGTQGKGILKKPSHHCLGLLHPSLLSSLSCVISIFRPGAPSLHLSISWGPSHCKGTPVKQHLCGPIVLRTIHFSHPVATNADWCLRPVSPLVTPKSSLGGGDLVTQLSLTLQVHGL